MNCIGNYIYTEQDFRADYMIQIGIKWASIKLIWVFGFITECNLFLQNNNIN
jgi:hypothetical protein